MIRLWRAEGALVNRSGHRSAPRVMVLLAAVYLTLAMAARPTGIRGPRLIAGPMAWLLSASKDLGPAHTNGISVAAALRHSTRPEALIGWPQRHHLNVRWQPGAEWADIEATPADLGSAFGAAIHDNRSRSGGVFYAAAQQPSIPRTVTV